MRNRQMLPQHCAAYEAAAVVDRQEKAWVKPVYSQSLGRWCSADCVSTAASAWQNRFKARAVHRMCSTAQHSLHHRAVVLVVILLHTQLVSYAARAQQGYTRSPTDVATAVAAVALRKKQCKQQ